MKTNVNDVMVSLVIVGHEETTVGEVRELMDAEGIHAIPIVDEGGNAVGIVTGTDVLGDVPADMPVREVMSTKVCSVPRDEGVHIAAREMRTHKLHHVVVTDGKRVVGILSSFDLLKLVEDQRFESKDAT